ncbi:hypothetical protein V495_06890 [Pseudogymnoascus sp. VKM F-4514 (FW-929)]|nr:hypothetical protein V495_06890 [Pseudogymnoascus sp. VKM F-4514 (FW-929)]KFY53657.1 hypothetical protein V497_08350 [Pseudogymnoascus sp. VKM F-4516 (FW-969)]
MSAPLTKRADNGRSIARVTHPPVWKGVWSCVVAFCATNKSRKVDKKEYRDEGDGANRDDDRDMRLVVSPAATREWPEEEPMQMAIDRLIDHSNRSCSNFCPLGNCAGGEREEG